MKERERKMMKKNIAMRFAAFLFVLTLISTIAFASTFAKYTTGGDASDEARVAKWGVVVTAPNEDNLFASTYNSDAVKSVGNADVVAPGTSGSLASFAVTGTPEVAVTVTYTANLTLTGWIVDSADYCPIVITVGTTKCTGSTMKELKSAVETAVANQSQSFAANTDLSEKDLTFTVTWEWALDGDDAKDTALGNLTTAPTIQLDVTCTVTQLNNLIS